MMNLRKRIDLCLKIGNKVFGSLAQELGMSSDELSALLERQDLSHEFLSCIAERLGVSVEQLLDEGGSSLPLAVYDCLEDKHWVYHVFQSYFWRTLFLIYLTAAFVFPGLIFIYSSDSGVLFISLMVCFILSLLLVIGYPLVALILAKRARRPDRVVVYGYGVEIYNNKDGLSGLLNHFPLNNIEFVLETEKLFLIKSYKNGSVVIPKDGGTSEELQSLRNILDKNASAYFVKGWVDFNQYSKYSNAERNRKIGLVGYISSILMIAVFVLSSIISIHYSTGFNFSGWQSILYVVSFVIALIFIVAIGVWFGLKGERPNRCKIINAVSLGLILIAAVVAVIILVITGN